MDFEFDPEKSDVNKRKHGIDFNEAQVLWNDCRKALVRSYYLSREKNKDYISTAVEKRGG